MAFINQENFPNRKGINLPVPFQKSKQFMQWPKLSWEHGIVVLWEPRKGYAPILLLFG